MERKPQALHHVCMLWIKKHILHLFNQLHYTCAFIHLAFVDLEIVQNNSISALC